MNSANVARSKEVGLVRRKSGQHSSHDAGTEFHDHVGGNAENGHLMAKMVLAQKMARRAGARGESESETTPPISQGRLA